MSVSASVNALLSVVETLDLGLDQAGNPNITHSITGNHSTLNATSTPPAANAFSDSLSLSAGAASLDLTALTRGNLSALDMTGEKVQVIKVTAAAANTDRVLVEDGATNGYNIFGAAGSGVSVGPGEEVLFICNESLPDVSGTAKTIDFSSADLDAIVEVLIVSG